MRPSLLRRSTARSRRSGRGFTLVELMIAVVIVGVLAMVAFPAYQDSVRKGRRAEGFALLAALQQAQERFRGSNTSYGNLSSPADALTLSNVQTSSPNGRYVLTVTGPSATGYVATVTAQGAQASDTNCKLLGVRMLNGNISHGSGASSIDWADPGRCWAK